MSEDVPEILRNVIHDPDAEAWMPMAGPLGWEKRTDSTKAAWTNGKESHQGLAIRDTFTDGQFIASTLYTPDLRRML